MIKRAEEMVSDFHENLRGGEGKITITHIFKQDEFKGHSRMIAKIELEPGSSIGYHQHVDEEEIFYILSGTAVLNDKGTEYVLKPGDASLTLGSESHSLSNRTDEKLTVMAVILLYNK